MDELEIHVGDDWEAWLEQESHQPAAMKIPEKSPPKKRENNPQSTPEYEEVELLTDEDDVDEIHITIMSEDEIEATPLGPQKRVKRKGRKRPAKRKPKSKQVNPIQ